MYRNRHQYTYVMPYGRLPMKGGNVYLQTGKTLKRRIQNGEKAME